MNTRTITVLVLSAAAVILNVNAAEENEKFPQRENRGKGEAPHPELRDKMMMRRFDKNGDGQLDEAEKAEMEKRKKEVLEKYDKDGDGQLGPEERKAFMEDRRKELGGAEGGRPAIGPEERQKIIEKFDKDGDGKLNDEERKAAFEAHRQRMGGEGPRGPGGPGVRGNPEERKMMMEKFDADGDGKLSDAEREKLREEMKKRMQDNKPEAE